MSVFFHPRYLEHRQRNGHPERPERLVALMAALEEEGLLPDVVTPEPLGPGDLEMVHTKKHIDHVRYFGEGYLDPDTYSRPETFDIALLAAGGAVEAVDRAWSGKRTEFCFPRPPGHHSGAGFFGGFCYFNNLALAVEALRRKRPEAGKVAVVDIDVHHGNGTSDIFYGRDDVLLISLHQWGIFPGTGHYTDLGEGTGEGYNLNVPVGWGAGDADYAAAFEKIVMPVLDQYAPDMLVIDVGMDGHYRDPLAGVDLTTPGFMHMLQKLYDAAGRLTGGRCAVILEGGYDLEAIADVGAGMLALALDARYSPKLTRPTEGPTMKLDPVLDVMSKHWDLKRQ